MARRKTSSIASRVVQAIGFCVVFGFVLPVTAGTDEIDAHRVTTIEPSASVYLRIGFGHAHTQPLMSRVRYGLALDAWQSNHDHPSLAVQSSPVIAMEFDVVRAAREESLMSVDALTIGGISVLSAHMRQRAGGLPQAFRVIDSGRLAAGLADLDHAQTPEHLNQACGDH